MLNQKRQVLGNSLPVQWLGLHASTAGDMGSIPGWGTRNLHAVCPGLPVPHPPKKEKEKGLCYNVYSSHHSLNLFLKCCCLRCLKCLIMYPMLWQIPCYIK